MAGAILLLLWAAGCRSPGALEVVPAVTERTGPRFIVSCSFNCEEEIDRVREVARSAWDEAAPLWRVESDPEEPLRVLLLTPRDYRRVDEKLANGAFRDNLAFSRPQERTAFVQVQPPGPDSLLTALGLPMQTLRLVAHEAAHLVSYLRTPPPRRAPDWLDEGLAQWVEERVRAGSGLSDPDPWSDPTSSTRRWAAARELSEGGDVADLGAILGDSLDSLTVTERYGVWVTFMSFLEAHHPITLRAILEAALAEFGAGGGDGAQFRSEAEAILRRHGVDFGGYRSFVEAGTPRWVETGRSLETAGGRWTQWPFPEGTGAEARALGNGFERLVVEVELRGSRPVAGVLVGPGLERPWIVRVTPGRVVLLDRDADREIVYWDRSRPGRQARVEISVPTEGRLLVSVDGDPAVEVDVPVPARPGWGLWTGPGSVAVWTMVHAR